MTDDSPVPRRRVLRTVGIGTTVALAGCSGGSNGAESTIRKYVNALFSKDAETANRIQYEEIMHTDYTNSDLSNIEVDINNLREVEPPASADREKFRQRESVSKVEDYKFTLNPKPQDMSSLEANQVAFLVNGEWKVSGL